MTDPPDPREELRARLRAQGYSEQQISAFERAGTVPGLPTPQAQERKRNAGNVIMLILAVVLGVPCLICTIVALVQSATGH